MVVPGKKIRAASARAHTRRQKAQPIFLRAGVLKKLFLGGFVVLVAWVYKALQPPPPSICGSPGGPPVTAPRIKLRDGRNLSYLESGVSKEVAKYKVVFIHGFRSTKHDLLPFSKEVAEEFGIYYLSFDRPGYGESDPDPKRTAKSFALDVENLVDQLGLGSKFYLVGFSMGGELAWTCLKYIPHRLAGAALLAPVSNFWWPGFPANISKEAYDLLSAQDQWGLRVAHYAPWLSYWWNTQKWFPSLRVISGDVDLLSSQDMQILAASPNPYHGQTTQQGEFESLYRDLIVGFGRWEFDPLELEDNPISASGPVHLWQGTEDFLVQPILSRYIASRFNWIRYHELPDTGHLFPLLSANADAIVKELLALS